MKIVTRIKQNCICPIEPLLDMKINIHHIFVRLSVGQEEGELVCYLVDSPRNACYCIFVTFARSRAPFCVHCYDVFSIASL